MNLDQIKELAGHRYVSPWVIKLVQDAVEIEREIALEIVRTIGGNFADECAAAIRARCSIKDRSISLVDLTDEEIEQCNYTYLGNTQCIYIYPSEFEETGIPFARAILNKFKEKNTYATSQTNR